MKIDQHFTDSDKKEIESTIEAVEKSTAGELVVMTVNSSSDYKNISYIAGFFASSALSMLIMRIIPFIIPESLLKILIKRPFLLTDEFGYILNFGIIYYFLLTVVLFIPLFILFNKYKNLIINFVPDKVKLTLVEEKALKEFYAKGIYKTKDKTGILILLSLLERKVYILSDKGIYEKISQDRLNRYAKTISTGIKNKNGKNALIEVLNDMGKILAEHFPIKPEDTNELSNSVVSEI